MEDLLIKICEKVNTRTDTLSPDDTADVRCKFPKPEMSFVLQGGICETFFKLYTERKDPAILVIVLKHLAPITAARLFERLCNKMLTTDTVSPDMFARFLIKVDKLGATTMPALSIPDGVDLEKLSLLKDMGYKVESA